MKLRDLIELESLRNQSPEFLERRATDSIVRALVQYLILPKIFFDPPWPSQRNRVDVLAIDRAGSGDVHVIEIKAGLTGAHSTVDRLMQTPANYRWLAVVQKSAERLYVVDPKLLEHSTGMGRIGYIRVVHEPNDQFTADIVWPAERFPGSYYDRADRFTARHKADLEFHPGRRPRRKGKYGGGPVTDDT